MKIVALVVVVLTSCFVWNPRQSLRLLRPAFADQAEAEAKAVKNAGLRADFKAPC